MTKKHLKSLCCVFLITSAILPFHEFSIANATECPNDMNSYYIVEASQTFTLEELSKYNGKDGNPAYIAVDGIVYDVTNTGQFNNGKHFDGKAGNDLTAKLKRSPHGSSVLSQATIVGKLLQ